MRTFEPFSDFLVVLRHEEASNAIDDGLITPEAAKDKPSEGSVLHVGPGYLTEQGVRVRMQAEVGNHVLFGKFAGTEIILGGQKVLLMRDGELLGRLVTVPDVPPPSFRIPNIKE